MISILGVLPTLEEAKALYADVYFISRGEWPVHDIQSTWELRVRTEELLSELVQQLIHR